MMLPALGYYGRTLFSMLRFSGFWFRPKVVVVSGWPPG